MIQSTSNGMEKPSMEKSKVNGILARARKIVKGQINGGNNIVKMYKDGEYAVVSSNGSSYDVIIRELDERCSCPAWVYGNGVDAENRCKHIYAVVMCVEEGIEIKGIDEVMEESE